VWTYVPWDLNNARPYWTRTLAPDQPITGTTREARVFTIYDDAVKTIFDVRVNERAGQKPTWSVLATRIWDHPALRARLLAKLEAALQTTFTPEHVGPYLDALWAIAGPEILADPFVERAKAETEPARLVSWVRSRRANLLGKLPALRAHGAGPRVVNEIGLPTATEPGYVELYNRGDTKLDLSGARVTDELRVPAKCALPAGTVVPAHGHLLLVADGAPPNLPFTISVGGGELGVFAPGTIHDPYDLVYFGPRASGSAYGRTSDGAEAWGNVPRTPGAPN
jgi:spore coat protein H